MTTYFIKLLVAASSGPVVRVRAANLGAARRRAGALLACSDARGASVYDEDPANGRPPKFTIGGES